MSLRSSVRRSQSRPWVNIRRLHVASTIVWLSVFSACGLAEGEFMNDEGDVEESSLRRPKIDGGMRRPPSRDAGSLPRPTIDAGSSPPPRYDGGTNHADGGDWLPPGDGGQPPWPVFDGGVFTPPTDAGSCGVPERDGGDWGWGGGDGSWDGGDWGWGGGDWNWDGGYPQQPPNDGGIPFCAAEGDGGSSECPDAGEN